MAAERRSECAQCILLQSVSNRRDQERAVNLLRWLRAIEAAPALLQLVVAARLQSLQFLCELFGFGVRYHAPHSQLLTRPIHTHIARFATCSQSYRSRCACLMRCRWSHSPSNRHARADRRSAPIAGFSLSDGKWGKSLA